MYPLSALQETAHSLLTAGKGILAADESFSTIGKRFAALDIPQTEEKRLAYRELLFTTPRLAQAISGVILYDETIHQKIDGVAIPQMLASLGIIPGIKVDAGTVPLPAFDGEKFTQGLDGLRERLDAYRELGARFTKWRAVLSIGEGRPSPCCLDTNARHLALFAALSQEAGLVPIVEPEVLMEGDHSLEHCEAVLGLTLKTVFSALLEQGVVLEGMILKSAMVLPGTKSLQQASIAQIVESTLRCFRRMVPAAVPGIVFLSGGQHEVDATERLNAFCNCPDLPWKLSFSYGRALQDTALRTWQGLSLKSLPAQAALLHRSECNGLAVQGKYSKKMELY